MDNISWYYYNVGEILQLMSFQGKTNGIYGSAQVSEQNDQTYECAS